MRRWGIENDTFSIIKQHPNLNMNFISFKKHEQDFTLNFLILKDGTLNFPFFKDGTLNLSIFKEGTLNFHSSTYLWLINITLG